MLHSRDRILTTHVGSLPRPARLSQLLLAKEFGEPYEPEFGIRDLLSRYNETGFAKQWGQPAQGRSRRRALSREKSLCQIIVYARIHISA